MGYEIGGKYSMMKSCQRGPVRDFPGGPEVKNLPSNAGDSG